VIAPGLQAGLGHRNRSIGFWRGFGGWEHEGRAKADQPEEGQDDQAIP